MNVYLIYIVSSLKCTMNYQCEKYVICWIFSGPTFAKSNRTWDMKCFILKWKLPSCVWLWDPMDYTVHGNSPGQTTGMGSLSFLQGIVPTQGSNPGLPPCRQILYQLSYKGNPFHSYLKEKKHIIVE